MQTARYRAIVEIQVRQDDAWQLIDMSKLSEFLVALCKRLKMGVLFPPLLTKGPYQNTNDEGITGFMFWQTSGCQLHTFVKDRLLCLDFFSCKKFEITEVLDSVTEFFRPERMRCASPFLIEDSFCVWSDEVKILYD